MGHIPSSYDMLGSIAIVEIPEELAKRKKTKLIGKAITSVNKHIRTVYMKASAMSGEYRVRKLKLIFGKDEPETIHKENGCSMKLDVKKVYYSVRLGTERLRIAEQVGPREKVLVLFAGVGPFAFVIAKRRPDAEITAVELNPDAVRYMEENIRLNKAWNVKPVLGDARKVVRAEYKNWADRVLMPLPKSAEDFLDAGFLGARDGGHVHFYSFEKKASYEEDVGRKVAEAAAKIGDAGLKVEVVGLREVRPYSPDTVQIVADILVRKTAAGKLGGKKAAKRITRRKAGAGKASSARGKPKGKAPSRRK
ncbi:MAG: class I SAM-dependent methyltransferase [Candidatus Bilamarchaeaceae archaeon]